MHKIYYRRYNTIAFFSTYIQNCIYINTHLKKWWLQREKNLKSTDINKSSNSLALNIITGSVISFVYADVMLSLESPASTKSATP